MIAELAIAGLTKIQSYNELRPLVESQTAPFVITRNPDRSIGETRRMPKHMGEQLIELKNEIGRVYVDLGKSKSKDFDSEEIETQDEDEAEEEEVKIEKPQAKGKRKLLDELEYFYKRVTEVRSFCEQREAAGSFVDSIGGRPIEAGAKLIPAGMPANALLHSMTLNWGEETRADAQISNFDVESFSLETMQDRGIELDGTFHTMFGYALRLAESRVPLFAIGSHGTGKSFLIKQLADFLELDYAETPMTPGASRGDLLGRLTASKRNDGFTPSHFTQIYSGGGVFNFEELDASAPEMLIVLNNALANESLFNSANATEYKRSAWFIAAACGNTFGTGATGQYTGRSRLDAASLDRFRMGRFLVKIDPKVERKMLFSGLTESQRKGLEI